MKKQNLALLGAMLWVGGCASQATIPSADFAQNAVSARFLGRPIEEAIAVYGMPDGQMKQQGHTVYVWRHRRSMTFRRPQTTTTTGRLGESWDPNAVPYTQVSTTQGSETLELQCVLTIGTAIDRPGVIDATALNGKMGACQDFIP